MKDKKIGAYLEIDKAEFDKQKIDAFTTPEFDGEGSYIFPDFTIKAETFSIKGDKLSFEGSLDNGLGYVSFDMELDVDDGLEVIDFYLKKINRMKTILEAAR